MSIKTILTKKNSEVTTCRKECTVLQCIQKMNEKKIGAVIVVNENGKLNGIITERDVLHTVDKQRGMPGELTVSDIMTMKEQLVTTHPDESIESVMGIMTEKRIRHLPVIEKDDIVGVISIGDVVKALLDSAILENESMKNYISGV